MTKKMTGYLGVASIFLCMILLTACANNSGSSSSGGAKGTGTSKATASSTASAAAMIARKASGAAAKKAAPTATPKPVVITISPRPTPTVAPAPVPTTPPMVAPTPTTPAMMGTNPSISVAADDVFNAINSERTSMSVSPKLTWDAELEASAHQHNLAMAAANKLSHQLPGEAAFGDRERAQGVNWTYAEENIAWQSAGNATIAAVALNLGMFNERPPDDGHRTNILSTGVNVVGVDVYVDNSGQIWLTEDFAHI